MRGSTADAPGPSTVSALPKEARLRVRSSQLPLVRIPSDLPPDKLRDSQPA